MINLGNGTAFHILSPELESTRADIADAFRGMLIPQDQAGWRPHVTIQNKVSAATARSLQDDLNASFMRRPVKITGLAAWRYRGGPWEEISRHRFGG